MFVLINLLGAAIYVVEMLISAYSFVVVAVCLISFVNPDPYNPIVLVLRNLTEPLLWRIRKLLPFVYGRGLDFSPIVLLMAIQVVKIFVVRSLQQLMNFIQ